MKTNLPYSRRNRAGFTLVELLVVIGIIAILAALLLPVLSHATTSAKKMKAKLEIDDIATAIQGYDSAYGRFPTTQSPGTGDFTYGGPVLVNAGFSGASTTTNDEVIAMLMDLTNYPGAGPTVNLNHVKNPQQHHFLTPHMATDSNLTGPGVGRDLVYRDPWSNPYVITMDLNYDEQCQDAFYSKDAVSHGSLNGLINPDAAGNTDNWQYHGKVMVWSAGPDGKADPKTLANQGLNKDNILSWK